MAISSVSLTSSVIGAGASQAQGDGAQQNPLAALQRKTASTNTQLSVFGRVKLTLDDIKAKAQALENLSSPPTLSDFKVAVQGFVQSLNALNKTVNEATAKSAAIESDSRPAQALNEIRKAVAGSDGEGLSSLQKIGISSQQDGTFSINRKQLEQSLRDDPGGTLSTLSDVADRVEKAADEQLSGNGSVDNEASGLNGQSSEQEETRSDAQARIDSRKNFQQLLAAQLANAGGYVARNAVTTYFSVAAL